ncbi:MAG TPA: rhamnulokinase family protein, partial [Mobilitalea sp.]|nr:rhamnulokinase family protein [Mobilitalea sp.]
MPKYYLAIDIGASGGRHILGSIAEGKIQIEEIYRFENGLEKKNGHLCWNLVKLFDEIKYGLQECRRRDKIPSSMGIDTWGVDFVLLDGEAEILGDTIGYRDHRTEGMGRFVEKNISFEELYGRTGIQKQTFNTINQLMAIRQNNPEIMEQAQDFLMLPDYFNYLLTGNKLSEYTNATTTQLINAQDRDWDYELIERLGYKKDIFRPVSLPGTVVGAFTDQIINEVGFTCEVVLPATHDTGSAVLSVPAKDNDFIYISSGTWSLMGIERTHPDCSEDSLEHNFTNEGGYGYLFRYLKNIMGLWMIQSVRHELKDEYSFSELCDMAKESEDFRSRVDVNNTCFLSPDNMTEAIKYYCRNTNQREPETVSELASCIYQSLA